MSSSPASCPSSGTPLAASLRRAACGALLVFVAACGGGGGGGSSDGLQIRFDRNSVSLTAQENPNPGQGGEVINATAVGGSASESVYVGAELQGVGIVVPIDVSVDTVARTAQITLVPNTTLLPGTYTGTVRLLACKDAQCAAHHVGSPFNVSYTAVITPRFKVSVASLDFATFETVQPEARVVEVTLPQGVSASTVAVEYGAGTAAWLQVSPQGSNYAVRPQGGLAVGDYSAVLRIEAGQTQLPIRIPVRHRVSAGLVVPSGVDVTINSSSPASMTSGEVPVTAASGVSATQWSASSSRAWLRLASASGSMGTPLRWQLDPLAFAAMSNQALHEAVLTVSVPGSALAPQELRFRLTKDVAELISADTLAVQEGEAGEVLLYGRGLDQLQQPATQVVSRGFTAQQVSPRSSSLMSLQAPALAAGQYEISLQTASGLPTRSVRLVVAAAQERHETWIDSSGLKGPLLWDAANQAAFTVDLARSAVVRIKPFTSTSNTTLEQSTRVVPNLAGIALSPDRRSVLATLRSGQLLELSPQDLSTVNSRELGRPVGAQWPTHLPLIVTADGFLLATGGDQWSPVLSYDLVRDAAVPLSSSTYTFYSGPWGLVSGNGQRTLVTQTAGLSPAPPLLRRDGVNTEMAPYPVSSSPSFFYAASADRRGTRWLLDNQRVVDFNLNTLGLLPVPFADNWYPQTSAMSRDGSRAYVFAINSTVSASRIFVFDTSTPVGSIQVFPLLGAFDPSLSPSCLSPTTSETCNGYASRMVLMDDDRTLVLAGDRRIGLVPVPASLRPAVPNTQPVRAPHVLARGPR
jgi:hypothetical protein